jgi:predicted amidophosphoribosyltransferase
MVRAANSLFGGFLGGAASATDHLKDALRGPARDSAFETAVEEGKKYFKQCTRCGQWVCPENCWNARRSLCQQCAPDLASEAAAVQAQVAREQLWEKARASDQTEGIDTTRTQAAVCPHCGARGATGKFCQECGKPMAAAKRFCSDCGAQFESSAKFCPECGKRAT